MLADDDWWSGSANPIRERLLRGEGFRPRLEQLTHLVDVLKDVELDLRFERVEPSFDRLSKPALGIWQVDGKVRIVDDADQAAACLDLFLGERMEVDHCPAGYEEPVSAAQGVHDALTFDSSQRPGEERQVEALPWSVHIRRTGRDERHPIGEVRRERGAGGRDLIRIRIDGQNGGGGLGVAEGQPAVAAAELEDEKPSHWGKPRKRVGLRSLRIGSPRHGRIIAPRSTV